MTTPKQQSNGVIDRYVKLYTAKYGSAPRLNRYKEQWAFTDMVKDLGYVRSLEVVEYYFQTPRVGHPVSHLLFNYDRYDRLMTEKAEDEVKRAELRELTRQRVEELEKNGNS